VSVASTIAARLPPISGRHDSGLCMACVPAPSIYVTPPMASAEQSGTRQGRSVHHGRVEEDRPVTPWCVVRGRPLVYERGK